MDPLPGELGDLWTSVTVVESTGSTNADLLACGGPEGQVLVAEEQTAGRGRMGRTWVSPPRAALMFSLLVRPADVPRARWGWLPLLAGVAAASAVTAVTGTPTRLKWPNDLLEGPADLKRPGTPAGAPGTPAGAPGTPAGAPGTPAGAPGTPAGAPGTPAEAPGQPAAVPGKLGGILTEAAGNAIVVGIGVNVSAGPQELPPPGPGGLPATSLRVLGAASLDRETLLAGILAGFEHWYQTWRRATGDAERSGLHAEYTRLSATLGRRVRIELPGGQVLSGLAVGVDPEGRLLVRASPDAVLPVAAGDVVHLR
jgi:BirA family transcriptional regulator, biotin operon repressor / biotin---[acetyl-CoA-carboxylase] ligase